MKYKCIVGFKEPIEVEVESKDYTEAVLGATIKATEQIKSTPFKLLAKKLSVVCYKID